ncbi:MAG TPA: UDP-N-acetylglucosamine 2-epimerase (non-hydrolyzing) [Flavobacteriales bacterium]|nr:UDP-N-acetylglucosamine 2-epimerase (non-hydrolyzing) [Flavobacteriales bacterium]
MKKLIAVIGTRPELIKTAPVIRQFSEMGLREKLIIVNTAQHKDLLDPFWGLFGINYDYKLDLMVSGQNLSKLTSRAIIQFQGLLDNLLNDDIVPVGILAQGDTTTVMVSSMVAFYNQIKFLHLEAGLRSGDLQNPFPEEFNRKVASMVTSVHFAPTQLAKENLINEGINTKNILVTGNTVVDALNYITSTENYKHGWNNSELSMKLKNRENIVLITCHRRENFGQNLKNIIEAIKKLADVHHDYCFVWAIHPNPQVKDTLLSAGLAEVGNIILTPPVNYIELLNILSVCRVAISDSGGIQEEAPSFNVPVLVLREKTERPEGVELGVAHLVEADVDKIVNTFNEVILGKPGNRTNPYGDGYSSIKIVDYINQYLF